MAEVFDVVALSAETSLSAVTTGVGGAAISLSAEASVFAINRSDSTLTLTLIDTEVTAQPGSLRVNVTEGAASSAVYFFLDGAATHFFSATTSSFGAVSVALPINNVTVGSHTVRVGATTALPTASTYNEKTFTVSGAPAPTDPTYTPQYPPTPPDAEIDRWVFQAYDFSSLASVYTYTLPVNPDSYQPVYGGFEINSEATTVSSGTVMSWEGRAGPQTMTWSGVVLTKADHAEMLKIGVTGQRLWVTDHYRRQFLIKIAKLEYQRVRDAARPWHHKYQAEAWLLSGDGLFA